MTGFVNEKLHGGTSETVSIDTLDRWPITMVRSLFKSNNPKTKEERFELLTLDSCVKKGLVIPPALDFRGQGKLCWAKSSSTNEFYICLKKSGTQVAPLEVESLAMKPYKYWPDGDRVIQYFLAKENGNDFPGFANPCNEIHEFLFANFPDYYEKPFDYLRETHFREAWRRWRGHDAPSDAIRAHAVYTASEGLYVLKQGMEHADYAVAASFLQQKRAELSPDVQEEAAKLALAKIKWRVIAYTTDF